MCILNRQLNIELEGTLIRSSWGFVRLICSEMPNKSCI